MSKKPVPWMLITLVLLLACIVYVVFAGVMLAFFGIEWPMVGLLIIIGLMITGLVLCVIRLCWIGIKLGWQEYQQELKDWEEQNKYNT